MRRAYYTPRRKARAALGWTLLGFCAAQLLLGVFLSRRHPDVCDPMYLYRRQLLRARLAEAPGRPLVLVLGSSRPACALQPATLEACRPGPDGPLVFNFAIPGAGPVRSLMILRRLLADGVRPDWLFVEVWAPFMRQTGYTSEERGVNEDELYWPDLPVVARLYHRWWEPLVRVLERAALPAVYYRTFLLHRHARFLLPKDTWWRFEQGLPWAHVDARGWVSHPGERPAGDACRKAQAQGEWVLCSSTEDFRISDVTDGAVRGLLELCRARGINVALFLMPEPAAVRAWYPAQLNAVYTAYLAEVRDHYGVPVIDARTWSPDEDFVDAFHLLPEGARTFSERLGREVFRPLMEGRPLPREALLREAEIE
jgi:hypothetical protein